MLKSAFPIVLAAALAALASCDDEASTTKKAGELCSNEDTCEGNGGCPFGFCTTLCNNVACDETDGAAGPVCTTEPNGSQICCPESGCPGDCNAQAEGQVACTSDANCCGGGLVAACADRGGVAGCYTICATSTDCDSGCCVNTGLTDVDTGSNVAGCVEPGSGGTCL